MIQEVALRDGLKKLLKQTEQDIQQRLKDEPELDEMVKGQHDAAVAAGRADAKGFLGFRDDAVTQAAVHWLLGCVFVRFLEDNRLIDEAWIAGPGDRLTEALDRRSLFYRENPRANDCDYLLYVFERVASLPDMADLYHREHNPLWRLGPTGPQAMNILRFFQGRDEATGGPLHDFTDPAWGTRFLGDLYQNLSDFARKRYALCQTPSFVIDFILDRTLKPAVATFGLAEVRLIDPTCGSGHFLLAAFNRLYQSWQDREPTENARARVQKVLDAVYGVDLNPFAVAIAKFRMLIAALRASGIGRLKDAPDFRFRLAAGDSLLHGPPLRGEAGGMQRLLQDDPFDHYFDTEDAALLRQILGQPYHAVVGNPPYINVQDAALREKYRTRYGSCRGKYQLGVPFTERFFNLALRTQDSTGEPAGFIGLIVSNAFMKRSFGIDLVRHYIPRWDLTHVIDTSGVYLPGHGTPTTILFGRRQPPVLDTVRAVRGIRGETGVPDDPSRAPVWSAIVAQVDQPGSESKFVSVADAPLASFHSHPWSIGGGGAAELKELLEDSTDQRLRNVAPSIGFMCITGEDDFFIRPADSGGRRNLSGRPLLFGESVQDWSPSIDNSIISVSEADTDAWYFRTSLSNRLMFGKTPEELGVGWTGRMYSQPERFAAKFLIAFGEVATHNRFMLSRGEWVFNQTAPVIKLPAEATEEQHLGLLGLLNSSTACFWLKQVSFPKGGDTVGQDGARVRKVLWDVYYAFDSTKLKQFPLPEERPLQLAQRIQAAVDERTGLLPDAQRVGQVPSTRILTTAKERAETLLQSMIALQEELDWQVYHLYGLLDEDLSLPANEIPLLKLGQRPFEILMARLMLAGELDTTWFERHRSTPITEVPAQWPERYRQAVEKRLEIIQTNRDIALIEQPEYKRRWNLPTWEELEKKALENWLLDRIEREDLWRELELKTCARLADALRRDPDFLQVAELYQGRPDFEVTELITALVRKQGVPFLPVLRYKPSGIEKRQRWEEVWDIQRQEDAGKSVEIPVPPKYRAADFLDGAYWNLRGGLDVPKERFVLYPHLERDIDSTPVLAWAGWDHLQQARALAAYYHHVKEEEGWTAERLKPVLAGLLELIPWLKQWHNEEDPTTGLRMGNTFADFVEGECQEFGFTVESLREWQPPQTTARRGRRRAQ